MNLDHYSSCIAQFIMYCTIRNKIYFISLDLTNGGSVATQCCFMYMTFVILCNIAITLKSGLEWCLMSFIFTTFMSNAGHVHIIAAGYPCYSWKSALSFSSYGQMWLVTERKMLFFCSSNVLLSVRAVKTVISESATEAANLEIFELTEC